MWHAGEGTGEGVMMQETTIEFVGGPLCGTRVDIPLATAEVAIPGCVLGCAVEYHYQYTCRVSVRGHPIFEYDYKRVLGRVGADG